MIFVECILYLFVEMVVVGANFVCSSSLKEKTRKILVVEENMDVTFFFGGGLSSLFPVSSLLLCVYHYYWQ